MQSRHPEALDEKISLGPVYAVNPRYVQRIEVVIIPGDVEHNWLDVTMIAGFGMQTELESAAFCEALLAKFIERNPKIEVVRYPVIAAASAR